MTRPRIWPALRRGPRVRFTIAPLFAFAISSLISPPTAHAFVRVTSDNGVATAWGQRCVPWYLEQLGAPDLGYEGALPPVRAAFDAWAAIDGQFVRFAEQGATCFSGIGVTPWPGRQNIVVFRDSDDGWPHAARVVALTSVTFELETGRIVDADIEVNAADYPVALNGDADAYDIQATLTHEVGHLLGLDHTGIPGSTMNESSKPGELDKRVLGPDDIAGAIAIHPASAPPPGAAPCAAGHIPAPLDAPYCPDDPKDLGCGGGSGAPLNGLGVALIALMILRGRPGRLEAHL